MGAIWQQREEYVMSDKMNRLGGALATIAVFAIPFYIFVLQDSFILRSFGLDGIANAVDRAKMNSADDATSYLCSHNGILGRYDRAGEFGNIEGSVTVSVGEGGEVVGVAYADGDASEAVQACMSETLGAATIPEFDAPPGQVRCQYAGTYMNGNYSLHRSSGCKGFGE